MPNRHLGLLKSYLAAIEREDQELRGLIESELASQEERLEAVKKLAQLTHDLSRLLHDVIRSEAGPGRER